MLLLLLAINGEEMEEKKTKTEKVDNQTILMDIASYLSRAIYTHSTRE